MGSLEEVQLKLDKKFHKVSETLAAFDLFVAIHDLVKYIESTPVLIKGLSGNIKANKELNVAAKYASLKNIYQGLEDIDVQSNRDLGHARYYAIRELNQIRRGETSESNTLWRKREGFKKFAKVLHERLHAHLLQSGKGEK